MFDQGRFNTLRFDIRASDTDEVMLVTAIHSNMNAMIVNGGDAHATAFIAGIVQGTHQSASTVRLALALDGRVRVLTKGYALYSDVASMAAGVANAARLSEDAGQRFAEAGSIGGGALSGANSMSSAEIAAEIESWPDASADYDAAPQALYAHIDAQVTTIQFTHGCAEFDVEIGPGQTLVIDSGGYVVLLDGENAIHAHRGDWLHLRRNTYDVVFEPVGAEAGALDAKILYTERWL